MTDLKRLLIVTDAWFPQINGVVRSLDQTARQLRNNGIAVSFLTPREFKTIPLPGYSEISMSIAGRRSVEKHMKAMSFDSLHIATEGPLGWASRKVALRKSWRFTTSLHTKFPEYLNERTGIPVSWGYSQLRRFHSKADATLVTTESQKEELAEHGIVNTKVWSRGVDTDVFTPQGPELSDMSDSGLPRPYFLYVGRLAIEKNIEEFLKLDLPGTKFLVGSGPDKAKLENKYKDAKFLGAKSGEQLAAAYRTADTFVFPSKTDTFGLVIVEALASGIPVAAFPVTGPKDIITNPMIGALRNDLRAACIESLPKDRLECRKHAMGFSWAACTERFQEALVSLEGHPL